MDATAARSVLRDAYLVRRDLCDAVEEQNIQRVRIVWVTSLTLLRSVGHVLAKVDSKRSKWIGDASAHQFAALKVARFENVIYWEFIENERNLVLKEYASSIIDRCAQQDHGRRAVLRDILIGIDLYTPQAACDAAFLWWERYLERVESLAAMLRRANLTG
ncbi:hypothetical protein DUT91_00035 [Phyllobacterium salinisoli]|uniref:Uncharacterized protein n=1 Tax=Phyllobacterium salinisoli TaxID=1899321 RepID=A0A368K7A3_9HYPH|nr:hypothetical protein DUT91_00035 [Phyllobacterium salinisoli]